MIQNSRFEFGYAAESRHQIVECVGNAVASKFWGPCGQQIGGPVESNENFSDSEIWLNYSCQVNQ